MRSASALIGLGLIAVSSAAPVAPNPLSLLKDKRVLVINGDNAPEYHKGPRDIVTAALLRMQAAIGIRTLKVVGNADTMTFASLDRYDVIFFNYFTRAEYFLGKPFEQGFRQWVQKGGRGVVGNHNTGAKTRGEWDWFRDTVTSMWYMDHKDGSQPGTIHKTADPALARHPILEGLDAKFTGSDEWYSFEMKPWRPAEAPTWKDCKVLYTLDEKSVAKLSDAMGAYHPVAWIREDAQGNRFFFTTLIHSDAGAASDFYQGLILRALEYAAGYREPLSLGAAAIRAGAPGGPAVAAPAGGFRIGLEGAWRAELFSADGRLLWTRRGTGPARLEPPPLAKPGRYLARLAWRGGSLARAILAY